jgi:hypothetical protein
MWIDKHLFATCSSGLCNRLMVLAGSIRIAQRTGRKLALYWPVNHDLGCHFDELFANTFPMVTEDAFASILDTTVTVKIYNAWRTQGPMFTRISANGDPDANLVIIKGWSYPMFENEGFNRDLDAEIRRRLLSFTPRPEIQSEVDSFPLPPATIGVHVRRGDHVDEFGESKDEYFMAVMSGILDRRPDVKFFLATDVARTEHQFRAAFGDTLLTAPKTWIGRHEPRGAREGLVDLLLLSRTAAILGNIHSSFSQAAGCIGNKLMIVADAGSAITHLDRTCDGLCACLPCDAAIPVSP